MKMAKVLSAALVSISVLFYATGQEITTKPSTQDDRSHRNTAIHWPKDYDPQTSPLFSHNDLLMPVSCTTAFASLIDADRWPTWLVFARDVNVPAGNRLQPGTIFSWIIFGKPIQSEVKEYEPSSRISWLNLESHYYQTWLFQPKGNGCLVTTEEIGLGELAVKAAAAGDTRTHRAHDLWLASLRWAAEGGVDLK